MLHRGSLSAKAAHCNVARWRERRHGSDRTESPQAFAVADPVPIQILPTWTDANVYGPQKKLAIPRSIAKAT